MVASEAPRRADKSVPRLSVKDLRSIILRIDGLFAYLESFPLSNMLVIFRLGIDFHLHFGDHCILSVSGKNGYFIAIVGSGTRYCFACRRAVTVSLASFRTAVHPSSALIIVLSTPRKVISNMRVSPAANS